MGLPGFMILKAILIYRPHLSNFPGVPLFVLLNVSEAQQQANKGDDDACDERLLDGQRR